LLQLRQLLLQDQLHLQVVVALPQHLLQPKRRKKNLKKNLKKWISVVVSSVMTMSTEPKEYADFRSIGPVTYLQTF